MDQTDFFKCLSDPTRLDIIKWVLVRENVCVCELTELLQLSQPKISRHLALLRNLSVLLDQRKGQWVYYRVNPDLPEWANAVLKIIAQSAQTDRETLYLNTSTNVHCD
ncbi:MULTISPECIES: ArsR/SmtB family transcription factor [Acinetobacter]|jgi:ArsR family transcriptional regulator|uniref:ArsR family transcriptional regulator n=1 Tax=Acinetobacter tandoii DSM 14970 = CIP 107469 TaxID=1120927 RepID=R9AY99_9GAMM|nr:MULTISPECIES: metalloregulator ArsR/SmtB family transcription factor [Acinetobacter]EOR06995.1 ArsR family transcriptional regulator [Acinetobacter tandoii DSM 14970 = CIP 107469]UOG18463.1 metalloregulator ArsR/SmtB family transcription factor [Acinetobacter sp. PK01]